MTRAPGLDSADASLPFHAVDTYVGVLLGLAFQALLWATGLIWAGLVCGYFICPVIGALLLAGSGPWRQLGVCVLASSSTYWIALFTFLAIPDFRTLLP